MVNFVVRLNNKYEVLVLEKKQWLKEIMYSIQQKIMQKPSDLETAKCKTLEITRYVNLGDHMISVTKHPIFYHRIYCSILCIIVVLILVFMPVVCT